MVTTRQEIPFSLDRSAGSTLTDQLEQGLRATIRSGHYPPGSRLPTIGQLAELLEVSQVIVSRAVRRLADRGELDVRPKVGIHVPEGHAQAWTRHVLVLHGGQTFYFTRRIQALVSDLDNGNIRATTLDLTQAEQTHGLQLLETILDTQPIHGVLLFTSSTGVLSVIHRRALPFIHVGSLDISSHAIGGATFDYDGGHQALAKFLSDRGKRNLTIIANSEQLARSAEDALISQGINCLFPRQPTFNLHIPERMERMGYEATCQAIEAETPPDAIYYMDDYACRGGLIAIYQAGLRVPEDIGIVTQANRGHCPWHAPALTRLELDPVDHAKQIADLTHGFLFDSSMADKHLKLPITLIEGGTI